MKHIRRFLGALAKKLMPGWKKQEEGTRKLPQWVFECEPGPISDEIIKDRWDGNVLHCANNKYTSPKLGYVRRRGWGGLAPGETHYKYIAEFLDLRNLRVLEMGPHEGHHSILIEKMGARESVAIEGNMDNMAKCLRIKEKYGLTKTTFYQANVEELYNNKVPAPFHGRFDLIFCLGFLYHLPEPQKAIEWFAKQSGTLFLGTHYVEKNAEDKYRGNFEKGTITHNANIYNGLWYGEYDTSRGSGGTLDGMSPRSFWLYENDLVNMAISSGYSKVHVLGKDIVNGLPYIYILADA